MADIQFILHPDIPDNAAIEVPEPQSAGAHIGEWYQELQMYASTGDVPVALNHCYRLTAKSCPPFIDAMCTGYVIRAFCDIEVEVGPTSGVEHGSFRLGSRYSHLEACAMHERWQLPKHPLFESWGCTSVGKLTNPWIIRTAAGSSCLFVSPLINQPDQRLYIFGGVVATDCYPMNVNLPFVVNCNKLKGSTFTLCKGEPIAVVIPFWREQWRKLVITRGDRGKSGVEHGKTVLSIFLRNAYRKYWRKVSNYKMV